MDALPAGQLQINASEVRQQYSPGDAIDSEMMDHQEEMARLSLTRAHQSRSQKRPGDEVKALLDAIGTYRGCGVDPFRGKRRKIDVNETVPSRRDTARIAPAALFPRRRQEALLQSSVVALYLRQSLPQEAHRHAGLDLERDRLIEMLGPRQTLLKKPELDRCQEERAILGLSRNDRRRFSCQLCEIGDRRILE